MRTNPSRAVRILLISMVFAAAGLFWSCGGRSFRSPSNIVIVCIDTVRYDSFWLPEASGVEDALSPWNAKAVRYRRAHSPSSWTVPAVASVLSGLYPIQHGAGAFEQPVAHFQETTLPNGLPQSVETITETLATRQYKTAAILSNPFIGRESGIMQGFEEVQQLGPEGVGPAASSWIQQASLSKQPFFLYLQTMEAHDQHWKPLDAVGSMAAKVPQPIRQRVVDSGIPTHCREIDSEWCRRYLAYVQSVLEARSNVASILESLERAGALRNTIVILYSDHGEELLENEDGDRAVRRDPRGFYGVGHGQNLSQILLHVPLLIWHPDEPGRDVSELVSLVDLPPTLHEWLGLPARGEHSGRSLTRRSLRKNRAEFEDRPVFASGIAYGSPQYATMWREWKRIETSCPRHVLYYRIDQEAGRETPTLPEAAPRKLEHLARSYRTLPIHATAPMAEMTAEQIAQLRALGYLQPGAHTSGTECPEEPGVSEAPAAAGSP